MAAMAVLPAGGAAAAKAPVQCDLLAYLANDGPAGTNVRSGPDKQAPVVLRAPGGHDAIATVTGFQDGWFRVGRLEQDNAQLKSENECHVPFEKKE